MTDWQPIETAPKDGTHILCKEYRVGYMNGNQQTPPYVAHWFDYGSRGAWCLSSGDVGVGVTPTHWMSLPDPPTLACPTDKEK